MNSYEGKSDGAAANETAAIFPRDLWPPPPKHLHFNVIVSRKREIPGQQPPPNNTTAVCLIAESADEAMVRAAAILPVNPDEGWYYLRDVIEHFDGECH